MTEFGELLSRPALIKLNLAANNLSFDIQAMAASLPVNNSMMYFNVSGNNLYGELTEPLGRMLLFNELLMEVDADDEALQVSGVPGERSVDARARSGDGGIGKSH
jgi:hypothetical protein